MNESQKVQLLECSREWNTVINRKKKRKKISDVNVRMKGLCTA